MTEKHDVHTNSANIRNEQKKRRIVGSDIDHSKSPTIHPTGDEDTKHSKSHSSAPPPKTSDPIVKHDRINSLNSVFETTNVFLESMKEGDKISLRDLSNQVAEKLGLAVSAVKDLVGLAAHNFEGVDVSRGRFGGVFKGERIKKEIRPKCDACGQTIRAKKNSKNESSETVHHAKMSEDNEQN